jgi:hypothetical protein
VLRNMQHLCNLIRPVQARQTLVHTLAAELQERRQAVQELRCVPGLTTTRKAWLAVVRDTCVCMCGGLPHGRLGSFPLPGGVASAMI